MPEKHVVLDEKEVQVDLTELYKPEKISRRGTFIPQSLYDEEMAEAAAELRVSKFIHIDDATGYIFRYTASKHKETNRRPMKSFLTGSRYIGEWNALSMSGKGIYRFPHGVIYDGTFNAKGEFHGRGTLIYPSGTKFESMWKNGKLVGEPVFLTSKGAAMDKVYCQMPDRRFQVEMEKDFNSAGQEYVTNEIGRARPIPLNCYDTGEGFYDYKRKVMIAYEKKRLERLSVDSSLIGSDFMELGKKRRSDWNVQQLMTSRTAMDKEDLSMSIPSKDKEDFIIKNCRRQWDEATGHRPEIYENWTYGAKSEQLRLATESLSTLRQDRREFEQEKAEDIFNVFLHQTDAHDLSRSFLLSQPQAPVHVRFKSFMRQPTQRLRHFSEEADSNKVPSRKHVCIK